MHMSHNSLIKYIYTTLASLMDIYRERVLKKPGAGTKTP